MSGWSVPLSKGAEQLVEPRPSGGMDQPVPKSQSVQWRRRLWWVWLSRMNQKKPGLFVKLVLWNRALTLSGVALTTQVYTHTCTRTHTSTYARTHTYFSSTHLITHVHTRRNDADTHADRHTDRHTEKCNKDAHTGRRRHTQVCTCKHAHKRAHTHTHTVLKLSQKVSGKPNFVFINLQKWFEASLD